MTRDELPTMPAVEFVELMAGLTREARVREVFLSAMVTREEVRQKSADELIEGLGRHKGRVIVVEE